jgi:hypothetical protein
MTDFTELARRYLILIEGGPPVELLRLVARSAWLRSDRADNRGGRARDASRDQDAP